MAWKLMTARQLNRRICVGLVLLVSFYSGLALAADLDVVSASERMDKLGAIGVLAFGFLIVCGALLYLIRLQYGKMMQVMERTSEAELKSAIAKLQLTDAVREMSVTMAEVRDVIHHCKDTHK